MDGLGGNAGSTWVAPADRCCGTGAQAADIDRVYLHRLLRRHGIR